MIDADTKICCVIGDPVEHSLSPLLHNTGYRALGLNFTYIAFRVKDIRQALDGIRALGIRGASVTIPHKITAMNYVDELDDVSRGIGAINTIVNDDGVLSGCNTDYVAALKALEEKTMLQGKKAVLLGSGGVALTIATGLKRSGAELTILNRNKEKAVELAKSINAEGFGGLDDLSLIASADILINATSVGMWPDVNESIVPRELLHSNLIVFDVVYNPKMTRLIREAKAAGCTIIRGYKMFLLQAAEQFKLFTGHEAPLHNMEKVLLKALKGEGRATSIDSR